MDLRIFFAWQRALWKIVTHPTFKVVAALALVALAAWIVVQTQADLHHDRTAVPLLFGQK